MVHETSYEKNARVACQNNFTLTHLIALHTFCMLYFNIKFVYNAVIFDKYYKNVESDTF
jgi:hypothetical protein